MSTQQFHDVYRLVRMLTPATNDSGDLNINLKRILNTSWDFFAPNHCSIVAFNPITKHFMWRISRRDDGQVDDRPINEASEFGGLTRQVLNSGILIVEHLADYPEYQTDFTMAHNIQALASIPIFVEGQQNPLAVLYLDYYSPHRFSEEERSLIQILANQAGMLLQQSWLLFRYAEITRISQEINQSITTVEHLFEKLYPLVSNILNSSHFFMLGVSHSDHRTLDVYVIEDREYVHLEKVVLQGGSAWAINTQTPLHIKHWSAEKPRLPFQIAPIPGLELKEESFIFVPLILRGVPLGILSVQHPLPNAYDEDDLQILQLLGNHVASALNNIRLFEVLQQINQSGQELTQQFESEHMPQFIVDHIRRVTGADVVVLYPYLERRRAFEGSPWISGEVYEPAYLQKISSFDDHVAVLTLNLTQPQFVHDSTTLYHQLGGTSVRRGNFEQREHICSTAAAPLRVRNESIGALFLNFRQPQRFDAPQRQLIQSLANYAAIAITNVRTFKAQVDRAAREQEILQQIDHALSQTLDLEATLRVILQLATAHIPVFRASIFLYDADQQALKSEATLIPSRPTDHQPIMLYLKDRRGLVWAAFEQRTPVRVDNVQTDAYWHDLYIQAVAGILSELDVPLLDQEAVIGVLNFESSEAAAFSDADERFLVTLAGQVVLAIKNAQAYEREKRLAYERQALITISAEIIKQLDPAAVFEMILDHALRLTHSPTGTLMLYNPRNAMLWMAAERGVQIERKNQGHSLGEGIVGLAGSRKTLINVPDVHAPPWDMIHLPYILDVRSELAVPLLEDDVLRGVLNIESPKLNAFSKHDERLLSAFAGLAVIALQNAERYRQATQRQQQLRALHEVDKHIISQTDDIHQVMHTILEQALSLTHASQGDLHLYEGTTPTETYFARADHREIRFEHLPRRHPGARQVERGIITHVAHTREPYRTLEDAQADPYYVGPGHIHSEVAVPLVSAFNQLVGVLNLESAQLDHFGEDHVELLQLLSGLAVIAIQTARAYLRFRLLTEAGHRLAAISDLRHLERAYEIVQEIVREIQPECQVSVRRYEDRRNELHLKSCIKPHPVQLAPIVGRDDGLEGLVARMRTTLFVSDRDNPQYGDLLSQLSPEARTWLGTPIKTHDKYYGNLALTAVQIDSGMHRDRELIEGLAQQLAVTISRLETVQARLKAEKEVQAVQVITAIGQKTFGLTHNLGNYLGLVPARINGIKSKLALPEHDLSEILDTLDQIRDDVRVVLDTASDLRTNVGRLSDAEPLPRDPKPLRVATLFEQLARQPVPPHVEVIVIPSNPDLLMYAVAHEVSHILQNLFTNAIEAMHTRGTLTLRAEDRENEVVIVVQDTGVGIPDDHKERIFDLFFTSKKSSGFGLWSSRRYAEANDGSLIVESQLGQGATFFVTLPRAWSMADSAS